MIRVFDFEMEGLKLRVAAMSFNMAQEFVKKSRELIEQGKKAEAGNGEPVAAETWNEREHSTILASLKRAGNEELTIDKLRDEMDIPTMNALYLFILEISGLRPTGTPKVSDTGEATAASTSARSEAA